MKAKTIKSVLNKKHNDFVESIKDEKVKKLVKKNSIITGGAIVSLLENEPVNDFDYYFTNKKTAFAVAKYYVNEFNTTNSRIEAQVREDNDGRIRIHIQSDGVAGDDSSTNEDAIEELKVLNELGLGDTEEETEESSKYRPVFLSENAITLTGSIQLVIRFYGDIDEIHDTFDYVHAKSYWRSENNHLDLPRKALESIMTKELIYTGSKYPLCSIFRARKFIKRGWTINAGQMLKMALQLNELDLHDVEVLKDQLTGVDSAYFAMMLEALERKLKDDEEFKITNNYLFELINRIF